MRPTSVSKSIVRALRSVLAVAVIAAGLATAAVSTPAAGAVGGFDDVPAGAFYSDAVAWLADSGITTGTSPTTFSPDDAVTRAQMAAFIARYLQVEGEPGAHGFGDVASGAYYDGPVSVLFEREITTGTSPTTYSPDDVVSRAQMAAFLYRVAGEPTTDHVAPFVDNAPGTYYYDAVRWMVETGVTTGTTPVTYSPGGTVTRAQMATFLWRLAGEPVVGTPGANRIDEGETVVAEEENIGTDSVIDPQGESEIEWMGEDQPDEGQVVVLGITDETPEGFIGEVTEVDGDTVMTRPARLQDALQEAEIYHVVEAAEADLAAAALKQPFLDSIECTAEAELSVDVEFDIEFDMVFEASWSYKTGVESDIGFDATLTTSVTPTASGAVECRATKTIGKKTLNPITFAVGPVPVVLVPVISLVVGVTGEISAEVELTTLTYEQSVETGIRLRDGRWRTVADASGELTALPPMVTDAQLVLGIDVRVRLDVKAYGIGGPFVTFGPYIDLTIRPDEPWWILEGGLVASIGAAVDVIFFKEEVSFPDWEIFRARLAESQSPNPFNSNALIGLPLSSVDSHGADSCGVAPLGTVWCWGDGRSEAEMVPGINDASAVNTGGSHSCAIHDDGQVSCWGSNQFGELGDGTNDTSSFTPVDVVGLDDAVLIEMGANTSCATREDWTLWCWGRNYGDTPVEVPEVYPASDLAIGNNFICATRPIGDVYCWGDNYYGQLGNGESGPDASSVVPVPVPAFVGSSPTTGLVEIESEGLHTCGRTGRGDVYCWGAGRDGQLGNWTPDGPSSPRDSSVPVEAELIGKALSVTAGGSNSCAVVERFTDIDESTVDTWCWGDEDFGQNGDGLDGHNQNFSDWEPVKMIGAEDATSVSAGLGHTCVHFGRKVRCVGDDRFGQLGFDYEDPGDEVDEENVLRRAVQRAE